MRFAGKETVGPPFFPGNLVIQNLGPGEEGEDLSRLKWEKAPPRGMNCLSSPVQFRPAASDSGKDVTCGFSNIWHRR